MLIVDNWRVLHGRTEVNRVAKRTIGGCYVKRDDYVNSLRQHDLL
jgi:alpha-ketoglutarate-dependent taurine dioxygenase